MSGSTQVHSPAAFKSNSRNALADDKLRASLRAAMDDLMARRAAQFPDPNEFNRLRSLGEGIRQNALARLPDLLEQLESKLLAAGVQVHFAETVEDAQRIFAAIADEHAAKVMVKGKSMASEEISLNEAMAERGVECLETDMGEYILQLDGDRPSHIIMPAIHKTKQDIAEIFEQHIAEAGYTEKPEELIAIARRVLREKFRDAEIGVSGVNFMVAETGTLVLVENEGNGRFCTSAPDVHIAIAGIEKVVEKLEHVPPLVTLLTRSATGQSITGYVNLLTGPRRGPESDGPEEMHLVLLDNGRSGAYHDEQFRKTLQCIRCGACMNHCPVYTRVGGHAYGTTYPGPIGAILEPHLRGRDSTRDLPTASSLCGACGDVCPVGIPIPDLLKRLRATNHEPIDSAGAEAAAAKSVAASRAESLAWKMWRLIYAHSRMYRAFCWLATHLRWLTPPWQGGWTEERAPLRPAPRSLRALLAAREPPPVSKPTAGAGP